MFGGLFKSAKKVQNKDVMEAVIAGCLLVAAADGEIEAEEISKMEKLLAANENLSAFKGSEIRSTVQRYTNVLEADFGFGQKKMLDEIADIADNEDHCEEVFLNMLAIAKADGEIEPEELIVLQKVAGVLRLNLKEFGLEKAA